MTTKFNLPRQIIDPEIQSILEKALLFQKIKLSQLSDKNLKELQQISELIENEGLPKHFIRKKLSKELGYGIFLHPDAKPLKKGDLIAPYSGQVSLLPKNIPELSNYTFDLLSNVKLTKEEQKLFDPKHTYHPNRLYSFFLDAEKIGNFTRFINHSEWPNVIALMARIPKNKYHLKEAPLEIIYLAAGTIKGGEQLLVSYEGEEKSYWGAAKIKPYPMNSETFQIAKSSSGWRLIPD